MNFLFLIAAALALIASVCAFFLFVSREKLRGELIRLQSRKEAIDQRLLDQQQMFAQMQDQLKFEFKATASGIFEDLSQKFSTRSEKQIGDLLNPLRERLGEFQKKVDESFGTQAKEQFSLKNEIERIVKVNEQMRLQTDSLTKALRGDSKAQGNWGEVMLERILEESGLRRNIDYTTQGGFRGAEENLLKPDVIVNLPENKHVIIDSKVSLTAYERYCAEADETLRLPHLKEFLKSLKTHVDGLEQRRYQDVESLGTPDFVLMFMPIEGAYSLAVQQNQELHSYAWGKKIIIVCPATLFVTLKTIASLWRIELQNQNAQEIARVGGALYDKFARFVEDMLSMGKQIGKLQESYDQARQRLSEGKGNLLARAEKLKTLGAKTSGSLPKELIREEDEEADLSLVEPLPLKKVSG